MHAHTSSIYSVLSSLTFPRIHRFDQDRVVTVLHSWAQELAHSNLQVGGWGAHDYACDHKSITTMASYLVLPCRVWAKWAISRSIRGQLLMVIGPFNGGWCRRLTLDYWNDVMAPNTDINIVICKSCDAHKLTHSLHCNTWQRSRSSRSLDEDRQPWMSLTYDSNMNSKYKSFINSSPHMSILVTLSKVGHINCHSLSHRHFQHITSKVLFHTHT